MCLIAYRKAGKSRIPHSVVDTALWRHPDGFGLAYRNAAGLNVERFGPALAERKAFRRALIRVDQSGVEYAAHWRFATHGPKVVGLAHPFTYPDPVEGEVAILHNGIIPIATEASESDTSAFVVQVLAQLPSAWWRSAALRFVVSQSIGWSKLVVMTATETVILNEEDGEWDCGFWYSSNHRPLVNLAYTSTSSKVPAWTSATSKSASEAYKALTGKTPPILSPARLALIPATTGEEAWLPDRVVRDADTFDHGGHTLVATRWFSRDRDGTHMKGVRCVECDVRGDAFVISGDTYFDIEHRVPVDLPVEERVMTEAYA